MRSSTAIVCLLAPLAFACSGAGAGHEPADGPQGGSQSTSGGTAASGAAASSTGGNSSAVGGSSTVDPSGGTTSNTTAGGTAAGGTSSTGGSGGGGNQPSACEGVPLSDIGGSGVAPDLTPGTWQEITPPELEMGEFGTPFLAVAPSAPYTIYVCADSRGLWKTEDGGSTWKRLGNPDVTDLKATSYLDSPSRVAVDPCDPDHLYATQGVRGETQGFWESTDGGETWVRPPGFDAIVADSTRDVTTLVVDPTDFNHVLVGSHSPWPGIGNGGVMESTDGGDTFVLHQPEAEWAGGSIGIMFLYDPASGQGDSNTWLVTSDGSGDFRTTDAGTSWTKVGDGVVNGMHGAPTALYTKNGTLFIGGWGYPAKSTDNGLTWAQVTTGLPYATYFGLQSDGETLYTGPSCACSGDSFNKPILVSPENDGTTWTEYQSGAQSFGNGPNGFKFESETRRLYAANWKTGVWALRVIDP